MVNMGVQYIIALVLGAALGLGFFYNQSLSRSSKRGLYDGLGILMGIFCSSVVLPTILFTLYTFFNCQYKSPGLWMVAITASIIAACNVPNIPINTKIILIPIAIVLQIIGLFVIQCNKKMAYSNVTKKIVY